MKGKSDWRFYKMASPDAKSIPDRLYIDEQDRTLYDQLKNEDIFKGRNNPNLFLTAMSYGFYNRVNDKLNKRLEYVRAEYINNDAEAMIYALALHHFQGDINLLLDVEKVFNIAEQYAHAGIKLLSDLTVSKPQGSIYKHLERMIYDVHGKLFK